MFDTAAMNVAAIDACKISIVFIAKIKALFLGRQAASKHIVALSVKANPTLTSM